METTEDRLPQVPLELAFHNLDRAEWAEDDVRKRVAKLARLHDRLNAVRVRIELDGRQNRAGNVFTVHIELSVPGRDLVVSREPRRTQRRYRNPTLQTAIADAFDAAERQLVTRKRQVNEEVRYDEPGVKGEVSQIFPERDHGFLLTNTGSQLYFHRDSADGSFDLLRRGDSVHYVETVGDTGPVATRVRRDATE